MKRKSATVLGNMLMGLGLATMVVGVGYSILTEISELGLPRFFAHGAIMSIFVGALLWLAGARIGGREAVADRYCGLSTLISVVPRINVTHRDG